MRLPGVARRPLTISLSRAGQRAPDEIAYGKLRLTSTRTHPPPGFRARRVKIDGEVFIIASYLVETEEDEVALTDAERAVAEGAASGKSNAQIAKQRGTSARTVANLLARAFTKLGVGSRLELAARWDRS